MSAGGIVLLASRGRLSCSERWSYEFHFSFMTSMYILYPFFLFFFSLCDDDMTEAMYDWTRLLLLLFL